MKDIDQISVKQAAELLGYSRVHVVRLINAGKIQARRIGRSYVVDKNSLGGVFKVITAGDAQKIETVMEKVFDEYEPALRKLGEE